jgi:hypothetical protein
VKLPVRIAAVALLTLAAAPAVAQPHGAPPPEGGRTANLQGTDPREFMNNRYIHDFYDLSVATLGPGRPSPDVAAYEQKAYAIFRAFGESMGMGGAAMQDHLKLIPRQVVQIAREDPHALDSFETFTDAMVGPK